MRHIKEEQISAYIDRQLTDDENRELEIHLKECSSCHAAYEEMCSVSQLFREAERFEPSAFLWNRIAAGIDREHPVNRGWVTSIMAGLRGYSRSWGMAAATLVILIVVGITLYHGNRMPVADQAALAQIDQMYKDLAAQDPDGYNPFSSGTPDEWGANPFKSMRLNDKTYSVPPAVLQH
jgi:predicted anti-sigma-YlaC factor YlaD